MFTSTKYSAKQKGFTLIEILVAIAILGIMAAAFLPLLTNSMSGIFWTGHREGLLYRAQSKLETFTGSTSTTVTEGTTVTDVTVVPISKIITTPEINGQIQEVEVTENGTSVSLYMFVPQ